MFRYHCQNTCIRGKTQVVKVSAANMNIDQIALEMLLDALERGQSVVMYGTGTSMEPTIAEGDAITVAPPKNIKIGDIVVILMAHDSLVAHRVIDIAARGGRFYVQTKGDNKDKPDPRRAIEIVKGKVVKIEKFPGNT